MRPVVLLCTLFVGGMAAAAPFVANVLPDPGFEEKSGWSLGSWEVCEYKSEYVPEAHSGQVAIQLNGIKPGKDGRISAIATSKAVPVQGGQAYLLGLWYRTEPNVTAAVSVISLSEPFAAKEWKTPQTGYSTYLLPPSANWRLWTMRLLMPEKAVEAVVLPRMQMVGTASFDDVSLLPADQARINLTKAGQIVKLPDERRYEGSVGLPGGCSCQLEIRREDGSIVQSLANPRAFSFQAKLATGAALCALVVEPKTQSLLAAAELPAPPLAEFELRQPWYRKTIYAGQGDDAVGGDLILHLSPALLKQTSFVTSLKAKDGTVTKSNERQPPAASPGADATRCHLRQPLPHPPGVGRYEFTVTVKTAAETRAFAEAVQVASPPPAGTHVFIVNADNALLMDGKPFFPRGFMGGGPEVYEPVAKAGYNIASSFGGSVESQLKWLDGLQKLGMYGITGVAETYVSKLDLEGLRGAVRQIRNHPALLGYYFPDEPSPDKPGMTPADWQPYYDLMVQEDPYHPVMTTMYNAEFARLYQNVLDILLFDPYPIRHDRQPLTVVSDYMLRARELTGDRKPVWCVPQAFGWDVIEGLTTPPTWTTPTPTEARCMTYLSLATGARGLLYYCYHVYTKYDKTLEEKGGWPWVLGGYLPDKQPALWGALEQIGQELRLLAPALDRPSRMWREGPVFLREISPVGDEIGYLIAVNTSDKHTDATVRLQSRLPRLYELEELERRTACVTIAGNEAHLKLSPLQVGIWKLPGQP